MWMPNWLTLISLSAVHFSPAIVHGSMLRLFALVGSLPVPRYGVPRIAPNSSSTVNRSRSSWVMVPPALPGPSQVLGMKPWLPIASSPLSSRKPRRVCA